MSKVQWVVVGMMLSLMFLICMSMVRYPVGEPVPAVVYTAPFEPDGAYRFIQTNFDPNNPKAFQAAPDDWITKFGNNERTLILYTISELRVLTAAQNRRILALEKLARPAGPMADDVCLRKDPNDPDCRSCHN